MTLIYKYQAATLKGDIKKGFLSAENVHELFQQTERLGLSLISYKQVKAKSSLFSLPTNKELIPLCIHLSQLLKARIPLLEALDSLRKETPHKNLNLMLRHVHQEVEAGKMLSSAFSAYPKVFTPFFTGLVKVGEETGNLSPLFEHLSLHLKWLEDLKSQFKKAIRYPMLLIALMGGVLSVMLGYLVPQFNQFYTSFHQTPPLLTLLFMKVSQALLEGSIYFLSSSFLSVFTLFIIRFFFKKTRLYIDRLPFFLPFFGPLYQKLLLARFVHFFSLLLSSGIPILKSFQIVSPLFQNTYFASLLEKIEKEVEGGKTLKDAFQEHSFFPPFFKQLLVAGEKSGNLPDTLKTISAFYDQDTKNALENFLSLIDPALKIFIGLILIGLTLGVFYPLYESLHEIEF